MLWKDTSPLMWTPLPLLPQLSCTGGLGQVSVHPSLYQSKKESSGPSEVDLPPTLLFHITYHRHTSKGHNLATNQHNHMQILMYAEVLKIENDAWHIYWFIWCPSSGDDVTIPLSKNGTENTLVTMEITYGGSQELASNRMAKNHLKTFVFFELSAST